MKSNPRTKKSQILGRQSASNTDVTRSCKPLDFDPSLLHIPELASKKRQSKVQIAGRDLFQILTRMLK